MHTPKHYSNDNIDEITQFITENGFGILVNQVNGKLWATHIPLVLSKNKNGQNILSGHVSKANPQWKNFNAEEEVLAIFSGPHAYISSSWYDHENVPTWNYIAVHVYGKIRILEETELMNSLTELVDKYEKTSENPVSLAQMSPDFLRKEIKGIVGFEIIIDKMEATYKLSQNRDTINHDNIVNELHKKENTNSMAIAQEMCKHRK